MCCCKPDWQGCGKRLCERHIEHHFAETGAEVIAYHCRHDRGKGTNVQDTRATGGFTGGEENTRATANYVGGKAGLSTNCGRHYREGVKQARAKKIGCMILIPILLIFVAVLIVMNIYGDDN